MFQARKVYWQTGLLVVAVLVLMQACGLSSPQPTATTEETDGQPVVTSEPIVTDTDASATTSGTDTSVSIVHTLVPADAFSGVLSEITDRDSSVTAAERRANGGENYVANLYERPFNANTMDTYFPYLDIIQTRLTRDDTWTYVSIQLVGNDSGGGMGGNYGVELDLDVDGRGDYLIFASAPGTDWSTDGVRVWTDANNDVGGAHPVQPDEGAAGDGYETVLFDSGVGSDPDTAWARISPSNSNVVEIAFKSALINDDSAFMWGVWTDQSVFTPAWYDYHDHFTADEIGSPLTEQTSYYPLKALAELDNTCRWAVGFTPTGQEPGICFIPPAPTSPPSGPGSISGTVYYNGVNGGLSYNAGISTGMAGISMTLRSGNCAGAIQSTTTTGAGGGYSFSVSPGTYCVSASTPSSHQTGPQTVTISSGGSANLDFFYYTYLGIR